MLLFDHLIGGIQEPFRNRQAECLGGFEIDHELEREQPPSVYNRGYAASREQAMRYFKARYTA